MYIVGSYKLHALSISLSLYAHSQKDSIQHVHCQTSAWYLTMDGYEILHQLVDSIYIPKNNPRIS